MNSASTHFFFYEDDEGRPTSKWRRRRTTLVPGCRFGRYNAYAPDLRWMVAAETEAQAKRFVSASAMTSSRSDGLGVMWDAEEHTRPMPYGTTVRWGLEALCGGPTLTLWDSLEDAQKDKARIDQWRCGGLCSRRHRIIRITEEEVREFEGERWDWVTM